VGDLVSLLAGGGIATVTGFVSLVIWWARADRADRNDVIRELRDELDEVEAGHRTERIRLQTVIDTERAGRRAAEDEAAAERSRRREAEDEAARLRRMVRELGGDPG
jgi:uncharacterized protein involved in exopolysaccharide biosynthesis